MDQFGGKSLSFSKSDVQLKSLLKQRKFTQTLLAMLVTLCKFAGAVTENILQNVHHHHHPYHHHHHQYQDQSSYPVTSRRLGSLATCLESDRYR